MVPHADYAGTATAGVFLGGSVEADGLATITYPYEVPEPPASRCPVSTCASLRAAI
ncbi:hypothetical protein GCM10011504_43260 [Siccirubricoccus deserti]|nr:hypothetical protein GCM10011504_43260 [Siccirubricoccus deserti]